MSDHTLELGFDRGGEPSLDGAVQKQLFSTVACRLKCDRRCELPM